MQVWDKHSIPILGAALLAVFFWIIGTFTSATTIEEDLNNAVKDFNRGWVFCYEKQQEQIESIPAKMPVKRGTAYTIKNQFPEDIEDGMTLALCATRQTGEVRVGGVLAAEIGNEAGGRFDKYPISKVFFIPLEKAYAGKEIEISLVSYNVEYSGRINEMYYGPYGECIKTNIMAQAPIAALYLFILFVGIILIVLFFFIREQRRDYQEILLLGVVTVTLVLSVVSEYNLFQSYMKNDMFVSILGFISKLILPFVYLCYINVMVHYQIAKTIFKRLAVFFLVSCLAILVFQFTGISDLGICMNYYTICTIVMYGGSVVLIIIEICMEYDYSKVSLFLALHILLFTVIVEGFLYFQNVMSYRNFGVFLGAGIICSLSIMGAVSTNNIIKTFEENRKIREELLEKRIHLMLRQIRPHYIYNTLNSIQALIEMDTKKAAKMINDFSRYLRTHIDTIESEGLVAFSEELEHIRTYVDIETVRFPKISVIYEIKEQDFLLPLLSVQPIVENAIRHGVSKKKTGGTVVIKTYRTDVSYVIEVNDDGVGFEFGRQEPGKPLDRQSVGIKNITYRLSKLMNATLSCQSKKGEGTNIRIDIPERGGTLYENNFSG